MSPPVHVYAVGDVLDAAATAGPPENGKGPQNPEPHCFTHSRNPFSRDPPKSRTRRRGQTHQPAHASPPAGAAGAGVAPTKRCVRLIAGTCVNTSDISVPRSLHTGFAVLCFPPRPRGRPPKSNRTVVAPDTS